MYTIIYKQADKCVVVCTPDPLNVVETVTEELVAEADKIGLAGSDEQGLVIVKEGTWNADLED